MTTPVASLEGWTAVILAGGPGTRMRSALPKVLHPVAGVPMVRLVCDLLRDAGCVRISVVAGEPRDAIARAAGVGVQVVAQPSTAGPAAAALAAREGVGDHGHL
ncbi:MAG: NTP transferase domain-containing protein, partial [Dehalococcoidia bacterium]